MGFFHDLKKLWHDIRSTRKIKDFGVVCETNIQGKSIAYSADLRDVSGERYLDLHRTVFRGTGPAIKIMDFNKAELDALEKDLEQIKRRNFAAGESDPDVLAEIKRKMGGSRFARFATGSRTIKNFNITVRQNTGRKRVETCLVLVEEKGETLLYLVRRETKKRSMQYDAFVFREADADLMADLFKDSIESM